MTIAELLALTIRAAELANKLIADSREKTSEEETAALLLSSESVSAAFKRLYPTDK